MEPVGYGFPTEIAENMEGYYDRLPNEQDDDSIETFAEIFEHRLEPSRRMSRDAPGISSRRDLDYYRSPGFSDISLKRQEDLLKGERSHKPYVRAEFDSAEGTEIEIYEVERLNSGDDRFHSNAPNSIKLQAIDSDDAMVLGETKYYRDPLNAFSFADPDRPDREEIGTLISGKDTGYFDRFYIPEGSLMMGYAQVHEQLEKIPGLAPIFPEIVFVEHGENPYDPEADFSTYHVRNFDTQHKESENYPDLHGIAALSRTMDVLGLERMDRSGGEILESQKNGEIDIVYESDRERMFFQPEKDPSDVDNSEIHKSMFSRFHSNQVTGERLPPGIEDDFRDLYDDLSSHDSDFKGLRDQLVEGTSILDPSQIDGEGPFRDIS